MRRRSFTLLETMLATSLASVVVMGCFAAFAAMGRADSQLASRFLQANDLARLQKTMQRTFTTLVVSPTTPLPDPDDPEAVLAAAEEAAAALEAGEVQARPRMLLEPDTDPDISAFLQRSRFRAGGSGSSVAAPQRLELVLSSVPIRPPAVQSSVWADALVGIEDAATTAADAVEEETEQYSGVRGAFVLRPDDPASIAVRRREAKGDTRIGWSLWWQPLDGRSEPARVASGLSACEFRAFYDSQMSTEHTCYADTELPRYVELEVETLNGLYANYLFEIVWTVDALVEEEEEEAGGAGGQQAGGQGGDTVTVTGNGGGARDGGQGRDGQVTDGQRRGRPRPNAAPGRAPRPAAGRSSLARGPGRAASGAAGRRRATHRTGWRRRRSPGRRRVSRRAFVMPMVLILVLVSSLMIAVMLERQSSQARIVDRQLRWYNEHHARLGLQEAIEAWIRVIPRGTELDAALPESGHFLDLELEDGTTAVVSFYERQNAILTDLAAVEPVLYEDASALIQLTALVYGETGPPDGLRSVGPAAVSAHTATEAALLLVAQAVLGEGHTAEKFVRNLVDDREANGRASASSIGIAAQEAEVEPEGRARLTRMITVRPTLFYAVIELRDSTIGPPVASYGGYFTVSSIGASTSGTSSGRSTFLTWERLAIE